MGLIKGKLGLQKMFVGYPTVSDKYDVVPATLSGADVVNGDVVMYTTDHSVYAKAASITAVTQLAGIVLATNVKVPSTYPAGSANVPTKAGEQFNLMVRGYIAVELDSAADLANAKEGAVANDATDFKVHQGYLEMSNISVVTEMVNMISIQRQYEANQKLITTYDESLDKSVNQVGRI